MSGSSLAARLEAAAGCSRQRRLANRAASPGARPKLCFPPLCALVTTSWGSSTGGDVSKYSHSFASWHQQRMQERKGVEGLGEGGNHQLQMEQEQQNRLTTRNQLNETVHGELGARSNSSWSGSCAFSSTVTCFTFTCITKWNENRIAKRLGDLQATWVRQPALSSPASAGVGPDDIQGCLPTLITLQFYDKLTLPLEICYLTPSIMPCISHESPLPAHIVTTPALGQKLQHMPPPAMESHQQHSQTALRPAGQPEGVPVRPKENRDAEKLACLHARDQPLRSTQTTMDFSKLHPSIASSSPSTTLHHPRSNRSKTSARTSHRALFRC